MKPFHPTHFSFLRAIVLILLAAAPGAWAQRTVVFANRVTSPVLIIAPIYGPEPGNPGLPLRGNATTNGGSVVYHGTLLKGTGFTAALYAGPGGTTDENQLVPIGTTTFRTTDALAGYFASVTPPTLTFPPGSPVTFQVRAWDNKGGTVNSWEETLDGLAARGSSSLFTPPTPTGSDPTYLVGLTSFCIASPFPVLAQIVAPPHDVNVPAGSAAHLEVGYVGAQPLSIQWRGHGTNLPGETSATLLRPNVQYTDAGPYSVVLSNRYNSVTSSPALLTVPPTLLPPERISSNSVRLAYDSTPGKAVTLEASTAIPGSNWVALASATNAAVRGQLLDAQATTPLTFLSPSPATVKR